MSVSMAGPDPNRKDAEKLNMPNGKWCGNCRLLFLEKGCGIPWKDCQGVSWQ